MASHDLRRMAEALNRAAEASEARQRAQEAELAARRYAESLALTGPSDLLQAAARALRAEQDASPISAEPAPAAPMRAGHIGDGLASETTSADEDEGLASGRDGLTATRPEIEEHNVGAPAEPITPITPTMLLEGADPAEPLAGTAEATAEGFWSYDGAVHSPDKEQQTALKLLRQNGPAGARPADSGLQQLLNRMAQIGFKPEVLDQVEALFDGNPSFQKWITEVVDLACSMVRLAMYDADLSTPARRMKVEEVLKSVADSIHDQSLRLVRNLADNAACSSGEEGPAHVAEGMELPAGPVTPESKPARREFRSPDGPPPGRPGPLSGLNTPSPDEQASTGKPGKAMAGPLMPVSKKAPAGIKRKLDDREPQTDRTSGTTGKIDDNAMPKDTGGAASSAMGTAPMARFTGAIGARVPRRHEQTVPSTSADTGPTFIGPVHGAASITPEPNTVSTDIVVSTGKALAILLRHGKAYGRRFDLPSSGRMDIDSIAAILGAGKKEIKAVLIDDELREKARFKAEYDSDGLVWISATYGRGHGAYGEARRGPHGGNDGTVKRREARAAKAARQLEEGDTAGATKTLRMMGAGRGAGSGAERGRGGWRKY